MSYKAGYSGPEVQTIRGALANAGFHPNYTVIDPNLFDAWVEAAVKAFQLSVGLKNDGIVGPNTWAALNGTSVQPATTPGPSATADQPATSHLDTTTPGASAAAPSSSTGLILFAGAAGALFLWWKYKKGGTLAGLPFGGSDDDEIAEAKAALKKEREFRKRKTAERIAKITDAYNIEVKRTGVNPIRAPGHAQALMNRVARAVDKEDEVGERLTRWQEDELAKKIDPARRAEILRESDEDIKARTADERAQARAEMRVVRGELVGRSKKHASPMYRQEDTKVGRKLFPDNTSPSPGLRHRTQGEDEVWLDRVESGRGAAQGTKRIVVSSRRYHTDKAYRASEEADARRLAEEGKREVQLVNERGVALYKYHPNVRNFKDFRDTTSEVLIAQVAEDAKKKNCPKAVRNLFRVRPLALDFRSEALLDAAAAAVAKNCADALNSDLEFREEARDEAGNERATSATIREVRHEIGLTRNRKKKAATFTKKSIEREIERGNITAEDGEALLIMARDEDKRIKREADSIFDAPKTRATAKYIRKRKGEMEAHVHVSPGGRVRTLRK